MKAFSPKHFAALIGIDWADKKHDVCEYSHTTKRYSFSIISSKSEAIHEWANDLKKRYPNQRIAVSCELKKGPLIYALSKYDHLVLFPINPSMQRYAGIAPVLERSGKQSWTHWRYSCPKFLRQSFVEWAGETVRYSFWAKAYYEQQKERGKPHQTIIRCLAFKWIRIIFACWKKRINYDESTYLKALKKRGSPLLEYAISG